MELDRVCKREPPRMRRAAVHLGVAAYGIAIFFAFDFAYSTWVNSEASPYVAVSEYHHGLLPNFDGYARFGEYRSRFITDSRGFRDAAMRDVPPSSVNYRVLLIGDSFTEGMAVTFEDSFAGLLSRGGKERTQPIEFLNAGVAMYSPIIYYRKIKYLLETGLRFDEVVVFSDISDVQDEATSYFCLDNEQYCGTPLAPRTDVTRADRWFQEHFVV